MKNVIPEDHKVFITHFRRFSNTPFYMTKFDASTEDPELVGQLLPNGGATEAAIIDPDGNLVSVGFSACSRRDPFNRKIGRDIATGRALKRIGEDAKYLESWYTKPPAKDRRTVILDKEVK